MISSEDITNLEKMGISFKLGTTRKYANVYKRNKFVGSIYNTKNSIYFCGREFIETNGKELIEFLETFGSDELEEQSLSNDEIFDIWKQCILEKKCADNFDKQYGKVKGYFYCAFRRLGLPKSLDDRQSLDLNFINSILKIISFEQAKILLNK